MFTEENVLLATAAVDVRIALLDADDHFPLLQAGETPLEQLFLCAVCVAGEFPGNVHRCATGDEVEDGGWDEFVGEDEVGRLDGFVGCAREEIGVARPGARENDAAFTLGWGGCARGPDFGGGAAGEFAEESVDVGVCDGGQAAQRPVFADLGQPAHATATGGFFALFQDELVEGRGLAAVFLFGLEIL